MGIFFHRLQKNLIPMKEHWETIWGQTARKVLTKSQMEKEEREEWEKLGGTLGYLDLEMQGFNHSDLCTPLKTENGANGKRKP